MAAGRPFGLLTATTLVVASMVGTGVFTSSGFLLEVLGDPEQVLLAWLAGGLIAACGALCYGALARRFPESGGEYVFLSRTLHPAAGHVAGWVSMLVGFSAPLAAAAFGVGEYLRPWLPFVPPVLTGSLLLLTLAWLHGYHGLAGARLQSCAVAFNVLLMAGFVLMAGPRLPVRPIPRIPDSGFEWSAFFTSLIWVSFSYSGWNAAVYIGGEVRDPRRNLPRALLLGTGLVTGLYLALNFVFLSAAPPGALAGQADVGRIAALALGGEDWARGVTGLVAFALSLSSSALMMAGPRIYARMARDAVLPRWFEPPADGSPRRAVGLQCALALALLWSFGFRELLTYIGFTLGLASAATVYGLVRLRRAEGARVPVAGWPWTPAIYLSAVTATSLNAMLESPRESLFGLATLLGGWLIWKLTLGRGS